MQTAFAFLVDINERQYSLLPLYSCSWNSQAHTHAMLCGEGQGARESRIESRVGLRLIAPNGFMCCLTFCSNVAFFYHLKGKYEHPREFDESGRTRTKEIFDKGDITKDGRLNTGELGKLALKWDRDATLLM